MKKKLKTIYNIPHLSQQLQNNEDLDSSEDSVMSSDRNLYLTGDINHNSVIKLIEEIHRINAEDDLNYRLAEALQQSYNFAPINLYINSYGGEVNPALALITTIESSETPIHTHCIGEAYSAALIVFAVGHERYAYKHSSFMYHQLSSGNYGNFKDIEEGYEQLKYVQTQLEIIFTAYTDFTQEELEDIKNTKKDYYFSYKEAIDKKVADKASIPSIYKEDIEYLTNKYDLAVLEEQDIDNNTKTTDND